MGSVYVLIHGGWHGGWCWDRVAPLLRREGHRVIAPDLPAHGLDTTPLSARPWELYVPRVCAILDAEEERVILVGHSSGGMIITDAARERPVSAAVLVYLSAFLLPPGVTPPEMMKDDAESRLMSAVVVDPERRVSSIKPELAREVLYHDCSDEDAAWATSRLVPEPLRPPAGAGERQPPPEELPEVRAPRVYIECLEDRALGPLTQRRMYTSAPCERVYSLSTSHSPFLSAPEQLAAHLLDIAARAS